MLENFQGDSWGLIPPLRMPSLLPHDLCHGRSASRWLPAVIEFQLSYSRSSLNMQYAGSQQISFRMDWLDLLAVQGTLKSFLQHHSLKASILWCSAFLIVQLSHPYMTTGKTIALSRWTFVSKVMSLLFKMLSRFVKAFLQGTSVF